MRCSGTERFARAERSRVVRREFATLARCAPPLPPRRALALQRRRAAPARGLRSAARRAQAGPRREASPFDPGHELSKKSRAGERGQRWRPAQRADALDEPAECSPKLGVGRDVSAGGRRRRADAVNVHVVLPSGSTSASPPTPDARAHTHLRRDRRGWVAPKVGGWTTRLAGPASTQAARAGSCARQGAGPSSLDTRAR